MLFCSRAVLKAHPLLLTKHRHSISLEQDKHKNQNKISEDDRKLQLSVTSKQPYLVSLTSSDDLETGVVLYYLYEGTCVAYVAAFCGDVV